MICFLGLGLAEMAVHMVVYFVLLAITFYRIMNEDSGSLIKVAKAALAIFVPFIGIALIWSEILIRTIIAKRRSV